MRQNRWEIKDPIKSPDRNELADFSPVMQQLLYNRGYKTLKEVQAFLNGTSISDPSPLQMKDMEMVVSRIKDAISKKEAIAIYGDYDVDGVTATVLLVQVLTAFGANVRPYIPNRFEEGYGLNVEALDLLAQDDVKLVISVDCGIRSNKEAYHAHTKGLDLIITDHHEPGAVLPVCYAILNPKQPFDQYPDKSLAGVGVAYKLAEALFLETDLHHSGLELEDLIDLVAIGTVADLAPLTGENRILVRKGISRMQQKPRQGLFSLANVAGVSLSSVSAMHIGFYLGPRLNAAGRLQSALDAFDLLMANNLSRAAELAMHLDDRNRERQAITRTIQASADAQVSAEDPGAYLLFAVSPDYNSGVVGLAASRLVETYYRPAVVGQINAETTRCSCRSIPEFHITHALDQCADLLELYGGHAAAAGFTVKNENLVLLKQRLKDIATEELAGCDLHPKLVADLEIPLVDLSRSLLDDLKLLQPTGQGNPEALFISTNVKVKSARTVGAEGKHLKLSLSDGGNPVEAIGFRMGGYLNELKGDVDILYTFEANEYNGKSSLQINLKDIKLTSLS